MEAYKVGVSLAMSSNAAEVLGALSRQLLGVHGQVTGLTGAFGRVQTAIAGAFAVAGGVALIHTMGGIIDKASELQRTMNNMRLAGMNEGEVGASMGKAWEMTQRYKTLSAAHIGNMINEVTSVYGDPKLAMGHIEPALKAATVLQSTMKGRPNAEKVTDEVFKMFKSADLRNITDSPEETQNFFDNMTKVVNATGGKVTPNDFLQMMKYSKSAGQSWTDGFVTRMAASMMQEGSASTVGTALASMDQNIVGGRMKEKEARQFVQMGLVDPSKVVYNKQGSVKGVEPGGVKGAELFRLDPFEWTQRVLKPALQNAISGSENMAAEEFQKTAAPLIAGMFGNRNAEWIANTMFKERPLLRDARQIDKAQGLDGEKLLREQSWIYAKDAFVTQWNNLLAALGSPVVQSATTMLNGMSDAIARAGPVLMANGPLVEGVMKVLAVAAVALTAAGIVAMGTLILGAIGPAGFVIVGLTTLGAAAAAFGPQIKAGFEAVNAEFLRWDAAIKQFVTALAGPVYAIGAVVAPLLLLGGLPTAAIVAAVAAVAGFVAHNWDGLATAFVAIDSAFLKVETEIASWPGRVGQTIADLAAGFVTGVSALATTVQAELAKIVTAIRDEIASWPGKVGEVASGVGTKFSEITSGVVTALQDIVSKIASEIASWPGKLNDLSTLIGTTFSEIVAALGTGLGDAAGKAKEGFDFVKTTVSTAITDVTTELGRIVTAIRDEIASWPGKLIDAITGMGTAIVEAIKRVLSNLNPFQKASGEGGSDGASFQSASYSGAGDGSHAWSDMGQGSSVAARREGARAAAVGGGGPDPSSAMSGTDEAARREGARGAGPGGGGRQRHASLPPQDLGGQGRAGGAGGAYPTGLAAAIRRSAADLGISARDLGTAISYETAGTFDPWKRGPRTKWGQHRGLIQWGEPQARQYGVHAGTPVGEQMQAVTKYLRDRGVRDGHGLSEIYRAINGGSVTKSLNASDGYGTIGQHIQRMRGPHGLKADQLLGSGPSLDHRATLRPGWWRNPRVKPGDPEHQGREGMHPGPGGSLVPPRPKPPARNETIQVNLDGRRVGQIALNAVARANPGVKSAAGFDSRRGLAPTDLSHVG